MLGDCGKTGKVFIKRQRQAFAAPVTQGMKTGFGAARDFAVGRYVLDGALERGQRDFPDIVRRPSGTARKSRDNR